MIYWQLFLKGGTEDSREENRSQEKYSLAFEKKFLLVISFSASVMSEYEGGLLVKLNSSLRQKTLIMLKQTQEKGIGLKNIADAAGLSSGWLKTFYNQKTSGEKKKSEKDSMSDRVVTLYEFLSGEKLELKDEFDENYITEQIRKYKIENIK